MTLSPRAPHNKSPSRLWTRLILIFNWGVFDLPLLMNTDRSVWFISRQYRNQFIIFEWHAWSYPSLPSRVPRCDLITSTVHCWTVQMWLCSTVAILEDIKPESVEYTITSAALFACIVPLLWCRPCQETRKWYICPREGNERLAQAVARSLPSQRVQRRPHSR